MPDVRLIDVNALKTEMADDLAATIRMSEMRKTDMAVRVLNKIDEANTIDAVPVVRCKECKNGAPLSEEARDEFSPGVMRCLAGRGDCDKYCTTWEDGFCDEGAKMDAKDMDVPTKDGGAE